MAVAQTLIEAAPALTYQCDLTEGDLRWMGRVEALLEAAGGMNDLLDFRVARKQLGTYTHSRDAILIPLINAYHRLELTSPMSQQGNFIPPGETWSGYAAIVRLIQRGATELLLVDPYMDATLFTELLPHSQTKQGVRCLTSKQKNHAALIAAYSKWKKDEIGQQKPVELRIAPPRSLHDRIVIVDRTEVWEVSQSFKDIAARSPASVSLSQGELARDKMRHYLDLWEESSPPPQDS